MRLCVILAIYNLFYIKSIEYILCLRKGMKQTSFNDELLYTFYDVLALNRKLGREDIVSVVFFWIAFFPGLPECCCYDRGDVSDRQTKEILLSHLQREVC